MMVASGTSTPTSITVVATRMLISPAAKRCHRASLSRALHLAVHEADACRRSVAAAPRSAPRRRRGRGSRIPRPAGRPSRPARRPSSARPTASTTSSRRSIGDGARIDRLAARRLLAQLRDVHVAEIGQHQRARDRRRGHHQHVDGVALRAPAPGADARRSGAARRRWRAPSVLEGRRRPGRAHACRPEDRSRPPRGAARISLRSLPFSRPVRRATRDAGALRPAARWS